MSQMTGWHGHFSYGSLVRGALGACSSSDCRYLMQPRMNSGYSGTTGNGSVLSGRRPQRRMVPTEFMATAVAMLTDTLPKLFYFGNTRLSSFFFLTFYSVCELLNFQ